MSKKYKFLGTLFFLIGFIFYFYPKIFLFFRQKQLDGVLFMQKEKIPKFSNKKYLGILEIPKIKIKNFLYDFDSEENNVDKNVYLVKGSTMPNETYSAFILAGHSGDSKVAYFRNLDKLNYGDIAVIFYQQIKYSYQLTQVYQEKKDGSILIQREKKKSHLLLITCDKKNKHMQNVYVFELISFSNV